VVLKELQSLWKKNFSGWQAGSDCQQAQGLTCDSDGMITSMRVNTSAVVNWEPASVTRLSRLTQLELLQVPNIPQGALYSMTWLKSLAVDCQSYTPSGLPEGVTKLTELTRLRLSNCWFKNEHYRLLRLTNLMELELPSNGIVYIENMVMSSKLTKLVKLDFSSNQLNDNQVLQVVSLPSLQFLNLSNNRLTGSLPESLTTMTNLVSLSVAANYMEGTIPPVLGKLHHLSTLDTNTSGLTCPDSYSSCGVPQDSSSGFCRTCPDFCTTCGKRKPLPPAVIAGIVAGVVVSVALATLLYFYCFDKPKIITNNFDTEVQQQLAQSGNRGVGAGLKDARMEARDELVLRVVQLALRCTAKRSAMRPAMGVIAAELEAVLVELGGERSNSAACQVDQQVESERMADADLDAEIARLNALAEGNSSDSMQLHYTNG
ncbi:unnamed protein product, partial [Closterium sp. Naga37s-1]